MSNIRISASRVKELLSCSWLFYCKEALKISEGPTHPKTICGSLVHSILECLKKPRHKKHYDLIMGGKVQSVYNSPAIARLIKMWQIKHDLSQVLIDDIDGMVMVVLLHTNYWDEGATQKFDPEHEFIIKIADKYECKGFLDRFAIYGNEAVISDYKSQGKKFTQDELDQNIQSAIYQLYVWRKFKLPARTEFILLRHAPTKKNPDKHLQVVPPKTEEQLAGLEIYLEYIGKLFENFDTKQASVNFGAEKNPSFCTYVCKFREPFKYRAIIETKSGKVIKTARLTDQKSLDELKVVDGQHIEILNYQGCKFFYPNQ